MVTRYVATRSAFGVTDACPAALHPCYTERMRARARDAMHGLWQRQLSVAIGGGLLLSAAWLGLGCSSASSSDPNNAAAAGSAGANTAGTSGAGASGSTAGAGAVGGSAAGGSAGGSGGSSGASAVNAACAAFAATNCAHYHDCLGLYFGDLYTSVADCETVVAKYCPLEIAAPGSSRTAEQLSACAQATVPQTCADWLATSPPICFTPGTEPNGASCEYARQCASTLCQTSANGWCGKCAPRIAVGQPCVTNDAPCAVGLSCVLSCPGGAASCSPPDRISTCTVLKPAEQPCFFNGECATPLRCSAGVCSAPKAIGQPCDASAEDCDDDSYCVKSGAGATCIKPTFAPVGSACDAFSAIFCDSTSTCVDGTGSRANQGTCKSGAGPGESCASVNCLAPAHCVNNVCALPQDAATCP